MVDQGIAIALLLGDRHRKMRACDRQPRLPFTKAAVLIAVFPNHRRATAIAALKLWPELNAIRVLQVLETNIRLWQSQFLTLINTHRTAQTHD